MTDGYKLNEIATELGRPPSWVSERLASLRNELLLQTGLFLPLTESEYEGLRLSIERHGVRSPVLVGEHLALIDGRHRLLIAEELGLRDIPAVFLTGLSAEAERELAIGLNAARRQLNRAQKRTLIEAELMRDPNRSDRLIASIAGVTHPTVAAARQEIAAQQAVAKPSTPPEPLKPEHEPTWRLTSGDDAPIEFDLIAGTTPIEFRLVAPPTEAPSVLAPERVDASGRIQRVNPRPSAPKAPERLGYAACIHGAVHRVTRVDGTIRLIHEPD